MAYDNPNIEQTFSFPVPDEWRSTLFSKGRTAQWTYKGPRYLTFEVDKETGRETGWCLTTEGELERPCPLNCVRITIDALENDKMTLLADVANDCGRPDAVQFRNDRTWNILHEGPEGYNHTWYTDEVEPRDIYDEFTITYNFETGEFTLPVKGWENEGRVDVTWDDVKTIRNKMLEDTDGKVSDDMPQALKDKWTLYRQLLRDLPTALAHIPAFQAAKMFPTPPQVTPDSGMPDPRTNRNG